MSRFTQHYREANSHIDMHGDEVPFFASDLMLAVYLVLSIVVCVVTA